MSGNLWGTLVGALTLGVANKMLEPYAGAVLGKIILLLAIILFIQKRPRGLFALKGRAGGGMITSRLIDSLDRRGRIVVILLIALALLVPAGNLLVPEESAFHVSTYQLTLCGKYLTYALLALSVDLVWGYCGILSLGHGAFFALGGYAMGMYLMRQIGSRGVYADPVLPDFMVFSQLEESLPWFWHGFDMAWYAFLMVILVPAAIGLPVRLAVVSKPRHRRLSLHHHPGADLCAAAGLLPQRHGFRPGNNGLTDFKDILGFPIQAPGTRAALFAASALMLALGFVVASAVVRSKLGKVLVAIRDAESRTRFIGYRVEHYKLFVWDAQRRDGRYRRGRSTCRRLASSIRRSSILPRPSRR